MANILSDTSSLMMVWFIICKKIENHIFVGGYNILIKIGLWCKIVKITSNHIWVKGLILDYQVQGQPNQDNWIEFYFLFVLESRY